MQEAQRLDALGLLADPWSRRRHWVTAEAATSWHLGGSRNGFGWRAAAPYLRDVLSVLQSLSGATMRVSWANLPVGNGCVYSWLKSLRIAGSPLAP